MQSLLDNLQFFYFGAFQYICSNPYILQMTSNIGQSELSRPQLKRNAQQHRETQNVGLYTERITQIRCAQGKKVNKLDPNPVGPIGQQHFFPSNIGYQSLVCTTLFDEVGESFQKDISKMTQFFTDALREEAQLEEGLCMRYITDHLFDQSQKRYGNSQKWVGMPRKTPQIVLNILEVVKKSKGNQQSQPKINFFNGYLSELSLFYFVIETNLLFFDVETMDTDSSPILMQNLEKRNQQPIYNIQYFILGQPYFEQYTKIMIIIHPYEAQFFLCDLKDDKDNPSHKKLSIEPIRLYIPLPQKQPNKLILADNGYLYTSDSKGKIFQLKVSDYNIDFSQNIIRRRFLNNSATYQGYSFKNMAKSINYFYKVIKDYSLSIYATKEVNSQLFYDNHRQIFVVFLKHELRKWQERTILQQFHVYSFENLESLYTLKENQFLPDKEEVASIKKVEIGINSECFFIIILKSGKKILLDLTSDKSKNKCAQITQRQSKKAGDFFIEDDLLGEPCTIHYRKAHPFGKNKRVMLQIEKISSIKTENLRQLSRQVFFPPRQLYYSTNYKTQKVIVLRPIDIFYSLFISFSQNTSVLNIKIKKFLPNLLPKDKICICCQLLVDKEGKYYVSSDLLSSEQEMLNNPSRLQSSGYLEEHNIKNINTKTRERLIQIIYQQALSIGKLSQIRVEVVIIKGILLYQARLFRSIFDSNISMLSLEVCDIIKCSLEEIKRLLIELRQYLGNCFSMGISWIKKCSQVILLTKIVSNLPAITLIKAIAQEVDSFSPIIFNFIIEKDRNSFHTIKKLVPLLVSRQLENIYHLYCIVCDTSQKRNIFYACQGFSSLPGYFIDYLVKMKKIPEQQVLTELRVASSYNYFFNKQTNYRKNINMLYSKGLSLEEKQYLLDLTLGILDNYIKQIKKPFADISAKRIEHEQLNCIKKKLKMQQFLMKYYIQRLSRQEKDKWLTIFSKVLDEGIKKQQQILFILNYCLLQKEILQDIAHRIGCTFVRVVSAWCFGPAVFKKCILQYSQEIYQRYQFTPQKMCQILKKNISFMLKKVRLDFSFEDITIIIDTCISLLMRCQSISKGINTEAGMLDKNHFWLLAFFAEIGVDKVRLYTWALSADLHQAREDEESLFLILCCAYMVKNWLPIMKQDLLKHLKGWKDAQLHKIGKLILS